MWTFRYGIREKVLAAVQASDDVLGKTVALLMFEAHQHYEEIKLLKRSQFVAISQALLLQDAEGHYHTVTISETLAGLLSKITYDDEEQALLPIFNQTDGLDRLDKFFSDIYQEAGSFEPPTFARQPTKVTQDGMTRDCFDPWRYLEICPDGGHKPCCRYMKWDKPIDEVTRNEEVFRSLRDQLLSGKLGDMCQTCSIRKKIPVGRFKKKVHAEAQRQGERDIRRPWKLRELRIDINEACNLRCSYCPVSHPDYNGKPMSDEVLNRTLKFTLDTRNDVVLHVNGHGETTYHPNWAPFCKSLVEAGKRPDIITNLAKNYSEDEIELLSHFTAVQVSLDSVDDYMMKKIRKPVRVGKVFETMDRIRAKGKQEQRRPPVMSFSVGVYDPSVWALPEFVDQMIAMKIDSVTFWNLVKYKHDKLTRPLRALSVEDANKAKAILSDTHQRLKNAKINHFFAGDFDGPGGMNMLAW